MNLKFGLDHCLFFCLYRQLQKPSQTGRSEKKKRVPLKGKAKNIVAGRKHGGGWKGLGIAERGRMEGKGAEEERW